MGKGKGVDDLREKEAEPDDNKEAETEGGAETSEWNLLNIKRFHDIINTFLNIFYLILQLGWLDFSPLQILFRLKQILKKFASKYR